MKKGAARCYEDSLSSVVSDQIKFDLEKLLKDHPEIKSSIGSNGKDRRFRNNAFTKIPLFTESPTRKDDIKVLGIIKNKRVWRYIPSEYVDTDHECLDTWKVLLPGANGSGALGEVLSTPLIGEPLIGYTQSFIAFGSYDCESTANAMMKYLKTKFTRVLLGVLKITQDNRKSTWKYVPLQDFTSSSDIDWSASVADIDRQLYHKYNLSSDEIDFIESHVKEMV